MSEGQVIEWKESWRDDWLRWICGFANAEGGTLVLGRNDRGEPVGVEDAARLLTEIPNKVRDLLGIGVVVQLREEQGRELLEIVVEPYPTPISYRGEYHFRSGSTKQELRGPALSAFLLRKLGRRWDGAPYPGVSAADLDAEAFKRFRSKAARSKRLEDDALEVDDAELLERLHLVEGGLLKRAALLLFHADPEKFCTGAFVKIGAFASKVDISHHDLIEGSLFRQFDMTMELLRLKYLYGRITYDGMQRVETFPVPDAALREALLNALIHKDYSAGAPIQIRVYADKLTIWNPGQLPPRWTASRLLRAHPSEPANPDLAGAFFRAGLIEAWGRGIEKIIAACEREGFPAPVFEHDGTGLWIEFPYAPEHVRPVTAQVAAQVTGQVAGEVTGEVTGEVADLLAVCEGVMTRQQLQGALALKSEENFRQRYLMPALAAGLIGMTIPDKPTSRLQKYRLTAAGKALLAARSKT